MLAEEIPKEHQKIKKKLILPSEKFIEKVYFLATISKQNTNTSNEKTLPCNHVHQVQW